MLGGPGSTGGCLIGALLVGLMANYTGFLVPKAALFSNIALMERRHVFPLALRRPAAQHLPGARTDCRRRPACHSAVSLSRSQIVGRGRQDPGVRDPCRQLRPAAGLHRHRELRAHHVLRHRRLRRRDRQHPYGARLDRGVRRRRWRVGRVAGVRPVNRAGQPARTRDLLRHDHAGGRGCVPDAGVAAV
ncbi:hypothetical protein G6F59_014572 [Rhizopus arrhizus]|nr:hypothetical protein G6F59_014572 [Rhizopus arrhizus]